MGFFANQSESKEINGFQFRCCCQTLKALLEEDPDVRGFSVEINTATADDPYALLTARSMSKNDEKNLNSKSLVGLRMQIAIKYCPWCGKRLKITRQEKSGDNH